MAGGDFCFDNLRGSHDLHQGNSCCQSNVLSPVRIS